MAALSVLAFRVGIHKLEYFVNHQIIGTWMHARAWELLIVMLAMESTFGISGLVAEPVFLCLCQE